MPTVRCCSINWDFFSVGGAFFEHPESDHTSEENLEQISIQDTSFVENHAQRAGGGYYISNIGTLDNGCTLTGDTSLPPGHAYKSSSLKCNNMDGNTVADGGYGNDIATDAEDFILIVHFENGTFNTVASGGSYRIPNWKSGDELPRFEV